MFQWKAFLWQMAFAAIVLVILALVTLYILSATGVLNDDDGPSTIIVAAPTTAPIIADTNNALFSLDKNIKAFKQPELLGLGAACSTVATGTACASGLRCVEAEVATVGTCQVFVPDVVTTTGGCEPGEVRCTRVLRESGRKCIIGRCILQEGAPSGTPRATRPAETDAASPKPTASAPLTGGSMVYETTKGETSEQAQTEIREALVTLHRHAADCAVGILHKDCTLDLLMQGWGVAT